MIGRFLSVDPVAANSVGGNFNRYSYANDNPYRFTDPDGRQSKLRTNSDSLTKHASNGYGLPTLSATDAQREMVKVAVDGKGSADEAADAFDLDEFMSRAGGAQRVCVGEC